MKLKWIMIFGMMNAVTLSTLRQLDLIVVDWKNPMLWVLAFVVCTFYIHTAKMFGFEVYTPRDQDEGNSNE